MASGSRRGRVVFAAMSSLLASTFGCGIDLTNSIEGRPCAAGRKCLSGYECSAENICVREGGGEHDASMEASTLGDSSGTGGMATDVDVKPSEAGTDAPIPNDASDANPVDTGADAPVEPDGGDPFFGIACRDQRCNPTETCCIASFPGFPDIASGFSCESDPDSCEYSLACDGDHDCSSGQVCCSVQESSGSGNPWVAECRDSCDSSEVHIECTRPEHCEQGFACCGLWENFQSRIAETRCQSEACDVPNRVFCADNSVCDPGTPNCAEASTLPGFHTCQ